MEQRSWNPLNDYLFKFIFGCNERKRVTLSLINAVLELENEVELTDIEFIDRDIDPIYEDDKLSKLDIYGIANDGSKINLELQVINRNNMSKRTLYYWAGMYRDLKKGQEYKELSRAITINILNFELLPQEDSHSMYGIYDLKAKHRLNDDLEIHFLEIPKLKAKSIKEMKRLEKWMAYFANKLTAVEMEELAMSEMAIKNALEAESVFMKDDIERRKYEQREKAIRDYYSDINGARLEGKLEGKLEMAMTMVREKFDLAMIAKLTGLGMDKIKELAKQKLI